MMMMVIDHYCHDKYVLGSRDSEFAVGRTYVTSAHCILSIESEVDTAVS